MPSQRIAILGGGITGLAAAHRARELDPTVEITLFEAGDRLGGVLQTIRRDGFLIERSADNFITNTPWAIDLCRRVGLEDQLQPTTADRRAFVVCRGKLCEVPAGFTLMAPARIWPMLATPILSPWGKLRMVCEYFVPARTAENGAADESLASFVKRRLGGEVFDRLVQPLIGGIYTADPEQLSLAATMPRFLDMERNHGGLIRGSRTEAKSKSSGAEEQEASGARYGMFVTLREGMSSLVEAIVRRLPPESIRLNSPVERIAFMPASKNVPDSPHPSPLSKGEGEATWHVFVRGENEPHLFDALLLATPAPQAAKLLETVNVELSNELSAIPHASSAVVCVGYRRDQFAKPLEGFGFVVPRIEQRSILSVSYASLKYQSRAPEESVLLRVFFGGAMQPEMAGKSDAELLKLTQRELADLLGLRGDPLLHEIVRWRETMPQYHVGHVERVQRIADLVGQLPNFALAGNAFHGVGIPHCIHSGEQAAEAIVRQCNRA